MIELQTTMSPLPKKNNHFIYPIYNHVSFQVFMIV